MSTGKSNSTNAAFLALLYQAVGWANVADNAGSAPISNVYYGLQINAGPGGSQSSNEADYPGYARQAVARTTGGHFLSGTIISPASAITFPQATGPGTSLTHFHTGAAVSGGGQVFHFGELTVPIDVVNGTRPQLTADTTVTEE